MVFTHTHAPWDIKTVEDIIKKGGWFTLYIPNQQVTENRKEKDFTL